ncbi:PAS domain S-box-containing protein [Halopenitus malekzadehii]|uniref:histidine kinase n=1 Tax=Halopenitus malekzadehii TaxID=1267564 RepID=A0A1H6I7Q0_9EURY|nr:ATP-binding protein [Halopenitus malekzadehii]SEH42269.1 PAS domain S-box-containing protein [Halopenitus malekzadehii]
MTGEVCVLYVDPDPDVAEGVATSLERGSDRLTVRTAGSAATGIDVLSEATIDCLVTALELPDRNGLAFLEQVHRTWHTLPIIVYPETGTDALVDAALAAGATDYLTRESDTDDHRLLAHRITNAVDGDGSAVETGLPQSSRSQEHPPHQLFRRAVEASGHSIYFTDSNGVIEYVNPAFEDISGYTAADAVGMTPRILKSGEHTTAFYAELWDTILAGETWRSEIVNETKDGERYIADQTIAPVENADGKITHFVAINADITETYEYEREIERQNERLDRFASVVSHDLRNPLNVAAGRLDLAHEEYDDGDGTVDPDHYETIGDALGRMERIIDDMLWLAREGRRIGALEPVPLAAVARRAWSLVADGTESATLSVRVDEGRTVEADPDRLRQLLENLYHNSVEHAGPDVTVTVDVLADGFVVADDGPGIPPEERDAVFDAGYSTADDGTGFGLSIVKQVVDAHDWDVRVTESPDGGARFEITGAGTSSMSVPEANRC